MQIANLHIAIKIIIAIVLVMVLSLFFMFDPSSFSIFPKCPFHSITGFHCPGCGSQRAIHSFMHGNLAQGFQHNFLILLLLIVVVYDAIVITVNKGFKNTTLTYYTTQLQPKVF